MSCTTLFISLWKVAGAAFSLNDITQNLLYRVSCFYLHQLLEARSKVVMKLALPAQSKMSFINNWDKISSCLFWSAHLTSCSHYTNEQSND